MLSGNRVAVTGARGFIGRAVVQRLLADGAEVTAFVRGEASFPEAVRVHYMPAIDGEIDLQSALTGHEIVIHCAARVHVMRESTAGSLQAFRRVNVHGTRRLAEQAANAGVRRFIFLSSVKAVGEATASGHPFDEATAPAPVDPYGISKREAEQALIELGRDSLLQPVIVRPPLVYGPGVKANFRSLVQWIARGRPLPLGGIRHNHRSLVSLDNLVDFIVCSTLHPRACEVPLFVSDGEDLSTAELVERISRILRVPSRLYSVPPILLRSLAVISGQEAAWQRISSSLQVSTLFATRSMGWSPPCSVDEGLRQTVDEIRNTLSR
jgi:nucleoside-diphosphate-sugar epimerase